MSPRPLAAVLLLLVAAAAVAWTPLAADEERQFTKSFPVAPEDWASSGTNPYFVLEPGYVLELDGEEDGEPVHLTITVLDETKKVDGVETRVVEERETEGGALKEVSRNYFAISKRTDAVYYFGEDVDEYEDGKVARHAGSWLSGKDGAKYGLMMPGTVLLGSRYHQEVAPGVAMDRAEIVSLSETLETPAGKFVDVLKTAETTPLEKGTEHKLYASGVGLVQDGGVKLVKVTRPPK